MIFRGIFAVTVLQYAVFTLGKPMSESEVYMDNDALAEGAIPDYIQPKIHCPDDMVVNSKKSSVEVSWTVKADDNSGQTPSVSCSQKSGLSMKVSSSTFVTCTATDGAGNTARCGFSIRVKDIAPPTIICPADKEIVTHKYLVRMNYDRLKVPLDNDGYPPAVLCSRQSGAIAINPGLYNITCDAHDRSYNKASCSFTVNIKAPNCKVYHPPKNGALACYERVPNTKFCTVSCNDEHDFAFRPGNSYICNRGKWINGFGHGLIHGRLPWPDCSVKAKPDKVMDTKYYYSGDANDPNVAQLIKQNFIKILKDPRLTPPYIGCTTDQNCNTNNVKVMAGKNVS